MTLVVLIATHRPQPAPLTPSPHDLSNPNIRCWSPAEASGMHGIALHCPRHVFRAGFFKGLVYGPSPLRNRRSRQPDPRGRQTRAAGINTPSTHPIFSRIQLVIYHPGQTRRKAAGIAQGLRGRNLPSSPGRMTRAAEHTTDRAGSNIAVSSEPFRASESDGLAAQTS